MLSKPKTPFKIHLLIQKKPHHQFFFYIFLRGWCLYISQNLDFRGVISILLNKKGLNRVIDYAAKTKKTLKRRFWSTQKHHIQVYWNPQKVMFFFLSFLRVFLVFWRYLVYFVTDWLIQLCNFFRTYLATISLNKTEKFEYS